MSANKRASRLRPMLSGAGLLIVATALQGCVSLGAKPWNRDLLARQSMALNDHPQVTAFHDHIYFSREGAAGGRTFDGGGCGCN